MSKLSQPLQIRLRETDNEELRFLSAETSVPFAVLVRLAVQHGLPPLKQSLRISAEATAGPMPATPSVSPAPAASSMLSAPCPVIVAGEDPDLNLR